MKILVVDDTAEDLYLLEAVLKGSGYEVVTAKNGADAIEKLKKESVDMIISDILMPVMDGFQLCIECKNDMRFRNIPFIFYTAIYTEKKDKEFALSLGADKFIIKPIDMYEFMRVLETVIKEERNDATFVQKNPPKSVKFDLSEYNKRLVDQLEKKVMQLEIEIKVRKRAENEIEKLNEVLEQRSLDRTNELSEANVGIKESELRWQSVTDSLYESAVIVYSYDGKIIDLWGPPEMDNRYGIAASDIVGKNVSDFISPDQVEWLLAQIRNVHTTGDKTIVEYTITVPSGNFWHETALCPMYDCKGKIKAVVGFIRDITKRKQVENAILIKNSYLKLLQVAAVAANGADNIADAFRPVLDGICEFTGWEIGHAYIASKKNHSVLVTTEVWHIKDKIQFEKFRTVTEGTIFAKGVGLVGMVFEKGKPLWCVDVTKDKRFLRAEIAKDLNIRSAIIFPVFIGTRVMAVMEFFTTKSSEPDQQFIDIMVDVGIQLGRAVERKQAKDELLNSKKTLDYAQKIARLGNWETDLINNKTVWSDGVYRQFGLTRQEFDGKNETFLNFVHPDDKGPIKKAINDALYKRKPYRIDFRVILKDGSERFLHSDGEVFFGEDFLPLRIIGTTQDMTERRQAEQALLQTQKMDAMVTMAVGVAHEFNNVLGIISGNAQFLNKKYKDEKILAEVLNTICRVADDGVDIADRMYEFAGLKQKKSIHVSVNLSDLIKEACDFTMPIWGKSAQAGRTDYHMDLDGIRKAHAVQGNPSELREVMVNIIYNALNAMPDGGCISFETKKEGENISVAISDTGKGMTENEMRKIFEPFFTTRSPEGTGLGMSVSYGIIKKHGGSIKVQSVLGEGSTITLSLPISKKSAISRESSKSQ